MLVFLQGCSKLFECVYEGSLLWGVLENRGSFHVPQLFKVDLMVLPIWGRKTNLVLKVVKELKLSYKEG